MILVDPAFWNWQGQQWAHLVSDESYQELHDFAAMLGIPRRAFQGDHYDVPSDYRQRAIALGASAVSSRELVSRLRAADLRRTLTAVGQAWASAIECLGGEAGAAASTSAELEARYREPHRFYHTNDHIRAVLRHAESLAQEVGLSSEDEALLTLAACAHDVVYDALPEKDEQASADWLRMRLRQCGVSPPYRDRVAAAVLATASHSRDAPDVVVELLLDADLAILASPREAYDRYVASVRLEYSGLDDDSWRRGRLRVLEGLSDRESLFFTSAARGRWEAAARANLERELRALDP